MWTATTTADFNDARNRYRNTSGKIAGWAVGIFANVNGGSGRNWHPAGNACLCTTLFDRYQYTQDAAYPAKIPPWRDQPHAEGTVWREFGEVLEGPPKVRKHVPFPTPGGQR